jgi:acetyl-CoA C-acetyltransferase
MRQISYTQQLSALFCASKLGLYTVVKIVCGKLYSLYNQAYAAIFAPNSHLACCQKKQKATSLHFMKEVVIVSAVRTPMGSFGGSLASVSATELGAVALKAALNKGGIDPGQVQEVYMGNVCQANVGQNPAKQVSLASGLPASVPCTTINKVCASGTKAIILAAQSIQLGHIDIAAAGGFESMSQVPYYVPRARFGYKYGGGQLVDGLERDGLQDVYQNKAMGVFADATAAKYNISREAQDAFAINSYKKAQESTAAGLFKDEIAPVSIAQKKGDPIVISQDEEPNNVKFDKILGLRPAFTPDGTVTAANASTINDGASALILMSADKAKELGIKPLARIVAYADFEQEPEWFTTAPVGAMQLALQRGGIKLEDVDYLEVNEAFAVVPLAVAQLAGADINKVNVRGGAVAMGHPLGSSGSRIVTTLTHILCQNGGRYGLAGICNGGGGASAVLLERL